MFRVIFLLAFLISLKVDAQKLSVHPLIAIGYVNQGNSFADLQAEVILLKNDDLLWKLGAGGLIGSIDKKTTILPKLDAEVLFNFEKGNSINHSYYFLSGISISPYFVTPKIGVNFLGIIDLTAGYTLPIGDLEKYKNITKTWTFGFKINLPFVVFK